MTKKSRIQAVAPIEIKLTKACQIKDFRGILGVSCGDTIKTARSTECCTLSRYTQGFTQQ